MPHSLPNQIQQPLKKVVAHPWVQGFLRLGFAAQGLLYFIIGLLVARSSLAVKRETAGTYGALVKVAAQPFGMLLLSSLMVGLTGYVLWRFLQATIDPEHADKLTFKRILQRLGYAISGFSYAGVIYTSSQVARGIAENDDTIEDLTAQLVEHPLGVWLVSLGGIAVIGVGLTYLYGAYTAAYISEFKSFVMPQGLEAWATRLGKVGIAARGIAFVLIGVFLVRAALLLNLDLAGGLGSMLDILERQPLRPLWLGLIAFGFIAYAIYMLLAAYFRRFIFNK